MSIIVDIYHIDPYPNEHAARIIQPEKFIRESFRRKNIAPGIDIIIGRLRGETETTTQAYRFKSSKFTVQQAKAWLREHNKKVILFEPASEDKGDDMELDGFDFDFELDELSGVCDGKTKKMRDVLFGFSDEVDIDSEEEITDRTPGIRRALKSLATTKRRNKKIYLRMSEADEVDEADESKPFTIGGNKMSLQTFSRAIGGIPKSWIEEKKKKKKDTYDFENVQRYDIIEFNLPDDDNEDVLTSQFVKTDEGYLTGRAIITNIGVFSYLLQDGSIRNELRLPREVLDIESLNSLKLKPFTNEHPGALIDSANIKDVQVGTTGDSIMHDSLHVSNTLTITDPETISQVEQGKRALSAGYTADLEMRSGMWLGVRYDAIQRNIRYNHVSLVDRGRAGDRARIRYDSADTGVAVLVGTDKNINMEDSMNLKKITLDGVEYQAESEVLKQYNQLKEKVVSQDEEMKNLKNDIAKLEADRDTYKDKAEKLESEKKEGLSQDAIDEAVERRLSIIDGARLAEVDLKKDDKALSETELMKAVVLKVFPKADETKLDENNLVYLEARFDGAVEFLESKNDAGSRETGRELSDSHTNEIDSNKARERMIARQKRDSRGIKEAS